MPKRLSDIEADRAQEAKALARWEKGDHPPVPAVIHTDQHDAQVMVDGERRSRFAYLGVFAEGEDDAAVYGEGGKFVPLVGVPDDVDPGRAAHNLRVERAFDTLTPRQQALLLAWAVEGKSLAELREHGESRQAVHERVKWAKNALVKALLATAEEPVTLTAEDL